MVFLQGRYSRAERWLRRAAELAGDDAAEQGRIACALGSVLSDTAEYGAALERLGEALALNRAAGDALGVPERRVKGDLDRFKAMIESRGAETGAWRGDVSRH